MRPLYAVEFEVVSRDSVTSGEVAQHVLRSVASWIAEWYLRRKATSIEIPTADGVLSPAENHEIKVTRDCSSNGLVSHSTVTWSYPDDNDGNLLWHSKCEIAEFSGLVEFSLQLLLDSTQFYIAPVEFDLKRPRIIATLVRQFECTHGDTHLSLEPHELPARRVGDFVSQRLYSRQRRLPIVLVSRTPLSNKWLIDPTDLADRLAGIAEVHVLQDKWAAYALSDEIGKLYSCYNGAVRLYWPDFDPNRNSYSPIYLPEHIEEVGPKLAGGLFRQLSAISTFRYVRGPISVDATDFLQDCHQREMDRIRREAEERGDLAELLDMADKEIVELRAQVAADRQESENLRASLQLSQQNLQAIWRTQEGQSATSVAESEGVEEEFDVASIEEAVLMAREQFSETLEFQDSATESARESPFKQPKRVYEALLAMHEVCQLWRQSRKTRTPMGSPEQSFANRGFTYKARESVTSKGKWREEYETQYKGNRVSIEAHLALGKGGPDTCLRIHFYPDESACKYIIAHVGRHKTNTTT